MRSNADGEERQRAGHPNDGLDAFGYLPMVADRITAGLIMTRSEDLVCVGSQSSVVQALGLMGESYDQLPVIDRGEFLGLVFKNSLEEKPVTESLNRTIVPADQVPSVGPDAPLRAVWEPLIEHTCVAVLQEKPRSLCGLIHFSDLNKHLCRSNAYLWISALEMTLAALVQQECPEPEEWLGSLDEHRQVMVLGRQEYDRRHHSDLAPTESLELSDLLRIIKGVPGLLDRMGYSKSQFDKKTGHLVKARNSVMHPVRSFVHTHADVRRTAELFLDLQEVLSAADRLLQMKRPLAGTAAD